jgi:hypothetical protein
VHPPARVVPCPAAGWHRSTVGGGGRGQRPSLRRRRAMLGGGHMRAHRDPQEAALPRCLGAILHAATLPGMYCRPRLGLLKKPARSSTQFACPAARRRPGAASRIELDPALQFTADSGCRTPPGARFWGAGSRRNRAAANRAPRRWRRVKVGCRDHTANLACAGGPAGGGGSRNLQNSCPNTLATACARCRLHGLLVGAGTTLFPRACASRAPSTVPITVPATLVWAQGLAGS